MRKLTLLPSYDVYSLLTSLRDMGVDILNVDNLKLSDSKNKELTFYVTSFTRPLINHVYGSDEMDIQNFGDVVSLFYDPYVKKALGKIQQMSEKLEIKPDEILKFMEDYDDIFLSFSHYRKCLDSISPIVDKLLEAMHELRGNFQLKNDQNLMQTINHIVSTINERMSAITICFAIFKRSTKHAWNTISADRFRKVETLISS